MGKFSAELTSIMENRNVTLADVVRDAGVSRAAFFKYRNGSRLPEDIRIVEKFADVLQLNFDERQRFTESYLIDQIGEYKYRGMMAIEKLLTTPAGFLRARREEKTLTGGLSEEARSAISGRLPVTVAVMSAIEEGLQKGDVTVFETISSDEIFRIISQVKGRTREHELVHIMAMNGSDKAAVEDRLYNVERLGSIVFTLCSCEGYRPCYYYASLSTLRTLGILQSNIILTKEMVLTYAADYSSAAVCRDPESVAAYKTMAEGIRRIAEPYAEKMGIMDGYWNARAFYEHDGEQYLFSPGICISSIIKKSDDLLEKHVRHDYEGIGAFLKDLEKYIESVQNHLASNKGKHHYIIVGPGVRFNYANGLINDFPKEAIIPLDRTETEKVLRRFRRTSAIYDFRVLDDSRFHGENTLWLDVIPGQALINIILPGEIALRTILIREQSTAALIFEYLSMVYENRTLTGAEREAWYDKLLAEERQK